jgi:folate-dependent phosphoribosylglycinamide formyltransferase PurN|tara:strand:+ start:411 stop:947 length:537 start_codon:yes stop_codon:yes gene_type:complete
MADTKWIAFFSQTGSEIADIADSIKRWPDVIITNDRPEHLRTVDERIAKQGYFTWSNKPTEDEYIELLEAYPDALVTLHGWLRIVPEYVCERSKIYNGHPGLITKYPELKGKDPQVRAFELKHDTIGCVLHEVVAGVDEGKVIAEERVNAFGLDLENTFRILRDRSLYLWVNFLKKVL